MGDIIAIVKNRIAQLEQAELEARTTKAALEDALMEDAQWQELDAQARDIAVKKSQLKDQIWGQGAYQEAKAQLKDIRASIRDLKEILNHELIEYSTSTHSQEITGDDGVTRRIKILAKIEKTNQLSLFKAKS